ncbi:MAG: FAD-dependent oxidoreductase [Candidatus Contendobacter sp.]|nr:FAD-dependent oxidoreductase [Candidatus Contendobacter sp.]MDG4558530.1 FAD-dependent oxidoreductase [Candidatus Contendobacter sp.]
MSGIDLYDLLAAGQRNRQAQCDVCVIGAGAVGIYLAHALAAQGRDVILVEAGPATGADAASAGFAVQFDATPYPGATVGRYFGLGGTTSRWGGLLIPHTHHDIRGPSVEGFDPWRHIVHAVHDHADAVLDTLGYRSGNDFVAFAEEKLGIACQRLRSAGLALMAGLFLPFRYKNLIHLLRSSSRKESRPRVFINAVVNDWRTNPEAPAGAIIRQVNAIAGNGNQLQIQARRFVVAAGAIESARLLLELNAAASQPVIRTGAAIGCFLADHLSLSIADVVTTSVNDAIQLFAPRFSGSWMRGFRFIEADSPCDAPRAFAHFIFDNANPGFALAKEMLSAMQGRRRPNISFSDVIAGLSGMVRLGVGRYVYSQLYVPAGTPTHLQLDIEQQPVRENCITLGNEKDRFGRRVARIRWTINDQDAENIRNTARRFLKQWPGENGLFPVLQPRFDDQGVSKPHDAYHPVGTCRLGEDQEAVVDSDLKVWGTDNLWVVSTGVLPSAGTANPTFTLLCLADKLARYLSTSGHD